MEQRNESIRERLLPHLPRPENLAGYRQETASLLARHEKALFWEKMLPKACYLIAAIMVALWLFRLTPAPSMRQYFWPLVGSVYFMGLVGDLGYRIYRSKVDMLKEVKQLQIQVLEIQAALGRQAEPQPLKQQERT